MAFTAEKSKERTKVILSLIIRIPVIIVFLLLKHVYSTSESTTSLELPSDDEDSDDDCIILEAESDEEQGQGCNNGGEDCSSVGDVQCDAECCRMEEVLGRPYQVRDGNILIETKKLQGKNGDSVYQTGINYTHGYFFA